MEIDLDTKRQLSRMARDEKWADIRKAAAAGMNNSGTNPSPQAQYLATDAAREGFEAGIYAARQVVALIGMHANSVAEYRTAILTELNRYFESGEDDD